jgi:hypothetical protein
MRKVVLAAIGSLALGLTPWTIASADLGTPAALTPAILSCNDGHSAVISVDQLTLTSLLTDIQAINADGTGTVCALDTTSIDPSFATTNTTDWTVYDYNSSNRALAPRNSPNKMPASTNDGGATWNFTFRPNIYTALFTTTDETATGNLCPIFPATCRTLNDNITVNGSAASFMTQFGGGSDCVSNVPASVRFFFVSPKASGSSAGSPPAGFYTKFWWSNPVSLDLVSGNQSGNINVSMADLKGWSDWDGKFAFQVPEAFMEATQNVQSIGLSFGGTCFFETGVTPTPAVSDETFSSMFSEA